MGHSVGDAAARSVKKSEKNKLLERTPERVITDIRRNLVSKLAVTPLDTAFLLTQYDDLRAQLVDAKRKIEDLQTSNLEAMQGAQAEIESLRAKNEEFRDVYEAENRRSVVTASRIGEDGKNKASVSVETPGILGPAAVATAAGATAATEA